MQISDCKYSTSTTKICCVLHIQWNPTLWPLMVTVSHFFIIILIKEPFSYWPVRFGKSMYCKSWKWARHFILYESGKCDGKVRGGFDFSQHFKTVKFQLAHLWWIPGNNVQPLDWNVNIIVCKHSYNMYIHVWLVWKFLHNLFLVLPNFFSVWVFLHVQ